MQCTSELRLRLRGKLFHFSLLKRVDFFIIIITINTLKGFVYRLSQSRLSHRFWLVGWFTMETENDNTIPFLDTLVIKDSEGRLTTSVNRKTTHTDQYLSCDSHHPQSVKHGVVKCLYDRSKNIITKPSVISEEKKHLSSVLVSNEYPYSFVAFVSRNPRISRYLVKTPHPKLNLQRFHHTSKGYLNHFVIACESMAYDLFSSPIQHRLSKKSFVGPLATSSLAVGRFADKKGSLRSPIGRLVASLDTTLRSHLVRPKDAVYPRKQDGVLYKTHCECGNICIGETGTG